mgnify:FL=1|jgi:SAM-dependent methyltransferase
MNARFTKDVILALLKRCFPRIFRYVQYYLHDSLLSDMAETRIKLFRELVAGSKNKNCLQIGVREKKYAPHWVSVDLYNISDLIDFNYDIHDLKFKEEIFDIVVCNAVLEHVEDPIKAIKELSRVLKKGGLIWVELPFCQPYHPIPHDFWRVSPEGIRVWMRDFSEISGGLFKIDKSLIYNGVYFYGRK